MPMMRDTVPIPDSTFWMNVRCRKCESSKFKMDDRSARCDNCGEPCVREGARHDSDTDFFYTAYWRYDPAPAHATNI